MLGHHKLHTFVALATVASSAFVRAGTLPPLDSSIVPNQFLVVYDEVQKSSLSDSFSGLSSALNSALTVHRTLNYPGTLVAQSVSGNNLQAEDLLGQPGVQAVYPVRHVKHVEPKKLDTLHADSLLGQQVENLASTAENSIIPDLWSPHVMTGVSGLRAQGLTGKGIKVCFVEGTPDLKHPIFGDRGCYGGDDCVIKFGRSYVNNGTNDPYGVCDGRSTHILGQMMAPSNSMNFVGAIPNAEIGWYQVFGCGMNSQTSDILNQAFLDAANDGCQIISNSLLAQSGWIDQDLGPQILNKLTQRGIVTVSPNGVDRSVGAFYASDLGDASLGIGAAGVDVDQLPFGYFATFSDGVNGVPYLSISPVPYDGELEVFFLPVPADSTKADSLAGDACSPLNASVVGDLSNKFVIASRGPCAYANMTQNLAQSNVKAWALFTNDQFYSPPYITPIEGQPYSVGLTLNDVKSLLAATQAGPVSVNFKNTKLIQPNNVDTGGKMSYYTSYGPTNDLVWAPTISVPATAIGGIFPNNSYGVIDATSSPLTAAIAALILEARASDNLNPQQIRELLSTTANPISINPQQSGQPLETTLIQGGGLVNASAAVSTSTLISPFALRLNDTANFAGKQQITIKNVGSSESTYKLSHVAAQTRSTNNDGIHADPTPSTVPGVIDGAAASVSFSQDSVTVAAGASVTVELSFTAPSFTQSQIDTLPLYSGFIVITDSTTSVPHYVSYFGLGANIVDAPLIDTSNVYAPATQSGWPKTLSYPFLADLTGNNTLQLDPDQIVTYNRSTGVGVFVRFAQATRSFLVDVIEANSTFRGTISTSNNFTPAQRKRDLLTVSSRSNSKRRLAARDEVLFDDIQVVGRLYEAINNPRAQPGPVGYVPFQGQAYKTLILQGGPGNLTDNTPYRILVRALKTTMDPTKENSWESWVSPPVQFVS